MSRASSSLKGSDIGGHHVADEFERMESFRAFIMAAEEGAAVPPVSEDDIKRLHELSVGMMKRYSGKDGALTIDLLARTCSPGANVPVVWLRHTQLRRLVRQGVLVEWQHETALEDAVYQVAATIPMNGLQIDQEEFMERLRNKAAS